MLGMCRGLGPAGRLLAGPRGSAWAVSRRAAASGAVVPARALRFCTTDAPADAEAAAEKKKEKKEKKKKQKKKKQDDEAGPVLAKEKHKGRPQLMAFEEHKAVTTDYIAQKLQEKIDIRTSESWLRRFTRKALMMAYAQDGGPAHEYMREHGITDVAAHRFEMLRVMHVYRPLAYKATGSQDPSTMSNQEWIDAKQNTLTRMMASQQFHSVFPDVLDKFTPKVNLVVEYDTQEAGVVQVLRGNEVPPAVARAQPTVRFEGREGALYTLLMVDPDAPARIQADLSPFLHWLVGNIPSNGDLSQGDTVAAYLGPGPPKGTDYHRYVYLLFEEAAGKVDYSTADRIAADTLEGRAKFDTRAFIKQQGLVPRGIAFFNAEHDEYVTELYESMGMQEPIFVDERTHRVLAKKDTKFESGRFRSWKVLDKEE